MDCLGLQNTFLRIKSVFKSFKILQFNYCPIVWMCFGRGLNNKISNIDEYIRKHYGQFTKTKNSVLKLLKRDNVMSIHMKNHIYLAAKVVQIKNYILQEARKKFLFFKKMKLTIDGVVIIEHKGIYEQPNMEIKLF